MSRVLVGGVADALARRIAERLRDDPSVAQVTGLDARALRTPLDGIRFVRARIAQPEWRGVLDTTDAAVWVVGDVQPARFAHRMRDRGGALAELRAFLRALSAHDSRRGLYKLVIINDGTLYGAQGPGPIREDGAARGYEAGSYARTQAQAADLIAEWAHSWPGMVTQLRPAAVCGDHYLGLAHWLAVRRPLVCRQAGAVIQALDVDDLISAATLAIHEDVPGVYNVAADAGVPIRTVLAHPAAGHECAPLGWQKLRAWWNWRWRGGVMPPGLVRLRTEGSWLEASAWRATGWIPRRTTNQALCASLDTVLAARSR